MTKPIIIWRDPRDLVDYEKNSRTHSDEQIRQVRASIDEFGFTNPILLKSDEKTIGAGHARRAAALLDPPLKEVPTITLTGLSERQWRAYVIADNRLALNAGWDSDLLKSELRLLDEEGFDLSLLGFEDGELADLLTVEPWSGGEGAEASKVPEELQEKAWRQWAGELAEQTRHLAALKPSLGARQGITPGYALMQFLNALHDGAEYQRQCYLAFHPNIHSVAGHRFSILQALDSVANSGGDMPEGPMKWQRLAFVCGGDMDAGKVLSSPLPFGGARMAADFPARLAKQLIDEFAPNGVVYDPCHGWGGRLVGFLLSSARLYRGTDPAPSTHAGVMSIAELFLPYTSGKSVELDNMPMEDWKQPKGKADLVLTSPPYFDVEKYQGGKQSREEHSSYESWREGFYSPLIEKAHDWLKLEGVFALQVGSQSYPLAKDGQAIAKRVGFDVESVRETDMLNNFQETERTEGEVVLILRKRKSKR